jgi:hypothetical protein
VRKHCDHGVVWSIMRGRRGALLAALSFVPEYRLNEGSPVTIDYDIADKAGDPEREFVRTVR